MHHTISIPDRSAKQTFIFSIIISEFTILRDLCYCNEITISLTNTDPYLINKAYEIFKAIGIEMHIHEYKNKKGSTRPVYDMQTAKQTDVKTACEALLPYLFGEKKAKAEMLLRFVTKRLTKLGENRDTRQGRYDAEDWQQFHDFRSPQTTREAPVTTG